MQEGKLKPCLPARLVVLLLSWTSAWLNIIVIWALILGVNFLWGFLNCLCSVRIAKGLCVPVGVFAFLLEYGCCLFLPSLSPSLYM